jgi:TRAP-type mannitol/chloroaromatic compound transport system substrate-binding protein
MSKKINRRTLIGGLASGTAAAAAGTVSAPAYAQGKRRLKMVTTWPKNFPGLGTAPENIAKRVSAMTDGQLEIKIYAAGELVGAFESFDAVSTGTADMYNGAEYYWQGKSAAFNFFTAVPFGMTAQELNAWIDFGGGRQLWESLSAKFNVIAFQSANTGVQMGGWFNKEITSLDYFKGLKIRMPGLGGEVMRRLGAAAVSLPGGEIFPSMKSGAIDASEWVGPWNDLAFGFHQVAKYYYCPGFHEPGAGLSTGVNLDVWNSLTPSQREIIRNACAAENASTLSEYNYKNATALDTLVKKHKVQVRSFAPEIMQALKQTSDKVLVEAAAKDPFTAKVFESFKASLANSMEWGALSEEPYTLARRKV